MPHKDPEAKRVYERERHRRRVADRRAQGLCIKCGKTSPAPGRSLCEPCGERGRTAERARYARSKAAGEPYGGRNPEGRRRMARERSKRRSRERREAGLCTRGVELPPAEGGAVCKPCREARRASERKFYSRRRAAGLCGRCGDGSTRELPGAAPAPRSLSGVEFVVHHEYPVRSSTMASPPPASCRAPRTPSVLA